MSLHPPQPSAGLQTVLKDWGFFALAASVSAAQSLLGLGLVASDLSDIDYAEWAVVTACMTVLGAVSQGGLKTGYMQLVVDDPRRHRQQQALRAATLFLFCSGLLAGLAVALGLWAVSWAGHWQNTAVVWVLPLAMAFGNAQMLLMTDLRIRRRLHWVTAMNIAALPIYSGFLFLLQGLGVSGLLLIFGAMALASAVGFVLYWLLVKPGWRASLRWQFLPAALRLGLPVMLGLLLKYATDMLVHTSMRWMADPTTAGDWGRMVRVVEPFGGIYFIALMMAWSPNAVLIAGARGAQEAKALQAAAHWTLGICLAGIPLAVAWAYGVFYFIPQTQPTGPYAWLILVAVVSRTAAFSAMAMAGYGNTLKRNYTILPGLYLLELGITACIVPLGLWLNNPSNVFIVLILSCWVPVVWLLLITAFHNTQRAATYSK